MLDLSPNSILDQNMSFSSALKAIPIFGRGPGCSKANWRYIHD